MKLRIALFASLACALPAAGQAQDYPGKPVHIVVGFAAGGGNDIIVRVLAPKMSEGLGQPVIVENKPGAQNIIAAGTSSRRSTWPRRRRTATRSSWGRAVQ